MYILVRVRSVLDMPEAMRWRLDDLSVVFESKMGVQRLTGVDSCAFTWYNLNDIGCFSFVIITVEEHTQSIVHLVW